MVRVPVWVNDAMLDSLAQLCSDGTNVAGHLLILIKSCVTSKAFIHSGTTFNYFD